MKNLKSFILFFTILNFSLLAFAEAKTLDRFVKDNKSTFFSDNANWELCFEKSITKTLGSKGGISFLESSDKKNYTVSFVHQLNVKKNESEVTITDKSGTELVFSGSFTDFIDFIGNFQKEFLTESSFHKLKKSKTNSKIYLKGSSYAQRKRKKGVFDEIYAQQSIIEKSQSEILETKILLSLEKIYD